MELNTGSDESTLDDKGRISIPVRFREQYQGKLIITRGYGQPCALIMTPPVWEYFQNELRYSEKFTQEERDYFEIKYLDQAHSVELDKTGRIAIPSIIRKYAKITKECTIISSINRLTVWDSGVLEAYLAENEGVEKAARNKVSSQDIFKVGIRENGGKE